MPYETQKKAIRKYLDGKKRVYVWCTDEEKKIIEQKANAAGKSVNQYIKDAALDKE